MRGVPVATGNHPSPPQALQTTLATVAPIFGDPAICRRGRKHALSATFSAGAQVGKGCAHRSGILRVARPIVETLRRGISASAEVASHPNEGPKVARGALRYLPPEPPTRGRPAVSVKGPKGPIIYIFLGFPCIPLICLASQNAQNTRKYKENQGKYVIFIF